MSEPSGRAEEDLRKGADPVSLLPNGSVLVDYGPMHMIITALDQGRPCVSLAQEGALVAVKVLEDLARFLPVLKKKAHGIELEEAFPDVVRRMIDATKKMEEPDLTPLAAVAGTASDVVADFLITRESSKIIVDNGGDISIRLGEGQAARVGVKTDILAQIPSYVLSIDSSMGIGGIATSGLGGRSFTKGIASAATVLSEAASVADAAATVIGNFTNVEDPEIERSLAEEIYPDTDIPKEWVTTKVGRLSPEKVELALRNGLSKADSLCRKGYIKGALIAVQGRVVWTNSLDPWISKIR